MIEKELYFDVVSEEGAGALYRIPGKDGSAHFYYHYTSTDLETDKVEAMESNYTRFSDFWKEFTANKLWFCLHPLFIHPDQRPFVREELKKVEWDIVQDEKWRDMYQRQWNKVLSNPPEYYKPKFLP